MYVGGDESQRALQLQNLEQLVSGYTIAVHYHRVQEPVSDFLREFAAYLYRTRKWSASCGPAAAIRDVARDDQEAWDLYWKLVDEFRGVVEGR